MKKFTLIILLSVSLLSAAPFGLKMGMSLEQLTQCCGGVTPDLLEGTVYSIEPTQSHPLFEDYLASVDDKLGLYSIVAIQEVDTTGFGIELKKAFYQLKDKLSKIYGEPKIIDEGEVEDSFLYVYELMAKKRKLEAIWSNEQHLLPDDLAFIIIDIAAQWEEGAFVRLKYVFNNYQIVEEKQDAVF